MSTEQRIALAAINPKTGDVAHNLVQITQAIQHARTHAAELIVFSEMALTGYNLQDHWLSRDLAKHLQQAITPLQILSQHIGILIGAPEYTRTGLYNSAWLFADGKTHAIYRKQKLAQYGVFDEHRYFLPGDSSLVFDYRGFRYGVILSEDLWHREPAEACAQLGAELLFSLHASPYDTHKHNLRQKILSRRAKEIDLPLIYAHQAGAEDDLIWDGGSMAVDAHGQRVFQAEFFHSNVHFLTVQKTETLPCHIVPQPLSPTPSLAQNLHQALLVGTADFYRKNNFSGAQIVLDGGLASLLSLLLLQQAIGSDPLHVYTAPRLHTAETEALIRWCTTQNLPIPQPLLADRTPPHPSDAVRILGIHTAHKLEWAIGPAPEGAPYPLHLGIVGDLWPHLLHKLAEHLHIPAEFSHYTIPPNSAEETIAKHWVEDKKTVEEIVDLVKRSELDVRQTLEKLRRQECVRQQAPTVLRVSPRAFGKEWRYPITPIV